MSEPAEHCRPADQDDPQSSTGESADMNTNEARAKARAAREAVQAVAKRQTSGHTGGVGKALKRYLAAEAFHERRREAEGVAEEEPTGGTEDKSST